MAAERNPLSDSQTLEAMMTAAVGALTGTGLAARWELDNETIRSMMAAALDAVSTLEPIIPDVALRFRNAENLATTMIREEGAVGLNLLRDALGDVADSADSELVQRKQIEKIWRVLTGTAPELIRLPNPPRITK